MCVGIAKGIKKGYGPYTSSTMVLKEGGIVPLGTISRGKGAKKNKRGNRGERQHKGGENAQRQTDY